MSIDIISKPCLANFAQATPLPEPGSNIFPLLIFAVDNIDFVNNQDDLEDIIKFIRTPVVGTRYYNPIKSLSK